ncbi:calcium-binding protein, partial [Undibacterium terreum]|uniref:calcium-binding protein n=1 Tax=Undibacterium terreum TaxID=1224302 RepID=UPI00166DD3EC
MSNGQINLAADNYALVRAAFTAMDQTYGKTAAGYVLQAIDNSGQGRQQPWVTPEGWTIKNSIEDTALGGKFVIYKNDVTNQVMVVPMGTNGNDDKKGWYTNFKDFGLSQWTSPTKNENGDDIKTQVYKALNKALEDGGTLTIAGDSKGGAITNFVLHDIIADRDSKVLTELGLNSLANIRNGDIAIITHSAPGAEDVIKSQIDSSFDPNGATYSGISAYNVSTKMQNGSETEIVGQVGGRLIGSNGLAYEIKNGVGTDASQVALNANGWVYLHRLAYSGYDGMAAVNGDFGRLTQVPQLQMTVAELQAIGGFAAGIGQGDSINNTEATARIGAAAICSIFGSPLAAAEGALKGEFGVETFVGASTLALFMFAPVSKPILASLCIGAIGGANGAKYLGDGKGGGLMATGDDLATAIRTSHAPTTAPDGAERYFGHTSTGGIYVIDLTEDGGQFYSLEQGTLTKGQINGPEIDFKQFNPTTGQAILDGLFTTVGNTTKWITKEPNGNIASNITTTYDPITEAATRDIEMLVEDFRVHLTYATDEKGEWELEKVESINGQPPIDEMQTREALINSGFDPMTGKNSAEAASIVYAESKTSSGELSKPDSNAPDQWWKDPNVQHLANSLTSIQGLMAALKRGDSLAIANSSFNILNIWSDGKVPQIGDISTGLNVLSDVLGLKKALDRGDTLSALRSGLSLSNTALNTYKTLLENQVSVIQNYAATDAFGHFGSVDAATDAVNEASANLASVTDTLKGIADVLPFLTAFIDIKNGDYEGAIVAIASYYVPIIGQIWAGFQILSQILDDDTPQGGAILRQDATGPMFAAGYGRNGGNEMSVKMMNQLLAGAQSVLKALPGKGFIAERMPTLTYSGRGFTWTISYRDQISGEVKNVVFDRNGGLISEGTPGHLIDGASTDDFFKSIGEIFVEAAIKSGAVAPDWMTETIKKQHAYWDALPLEPIDSNDPYEIAISGGFKQRNERVGLNAMQWAIEDGNVLTAPANAPLQSVRPIVLDLEGDGIKTTSRDQGNGVLFDVDDDGFAEETDWVNPRDGILVLDRDGNGSINGGHELFNDVGIDTAKRGLGALKEIDSNYDNKLTAADPVFSHMRVWRDINMDGVAQDSELKSFADLGITVIDFAAGSFTINGVTHQVGLANLTADTDGVLTSVTDNNLHVVHEDSTIESYATGVQDLTKLQDGKLHSATSADGKLSAGFDRIDGVEDVSVSVNATQLLNNDSITGAGLDHSSLKITSVINGVGGEVDYDAATGAIKFWPNLDFNGSGSFTYILTDGAGRTAQGIVTVNVAAVNDLPSISNSSITKPVASSRLVEHSADEQFPGGRYSLPTTVRVDDKIAAPIGNISTIWGMANGGISINGKSYELGSLNGMLFAGVVTNGHTEWHSIVELDKFGGKILGEDVEDGANVSYSVAQDARFGHVAINQVDGTWTYTRTIDQFANTGLHQDDAFIARVTDKTGGSSQLKVIIPESGLSEIIPRKVVRLGVGANNSNHSGAVHGIGSGAAVSAANGTVVPRRDPLALDLDGDGIETVIDNHGAPILFDHDADGVKTGTGWLSPDDGWLALDRNGNGTIDSGRELFGVDTVLKNGQLATNGFAALADLDDNGDGKIDASDAAYSSLRIWRDLNQDGISQANELSSLAANNITSISLGANAVRHDFGNGNVQTAAGTFTRGDGTVGNSGEISSNIANLDLLQNSFYSEFTDSIKLTDQAMNLPSLAGSGRVRNLSEAISLSPDLGSWVWQYTQKKTRDEQLPMLDSFVEKWAGTSTFKTLKQQADALSSSGVSLTYHLEGLAAGTAEYNEFLKKLGIVERFMGFTYGGAQGQARTTLLDASSGSLNVTLTSSQINNILLAYDRFKGDIYESLALSTIYKDFLTIPISQKNDGKFEISGIEKYFDAAFQKDPRNGAIALIEIVSAWGEKNAQAIGWDPIPYLARKLTEAGDLGGFNEELSSWTVRFMAATESQFSGTVRDDLIVGNGQDNYLFGGNGNDILIGGAGMDHLSGGAGSDTYVFGRGAGHDIIDNASYNDTNKVDTLLLVGLNPADVTFTRGENTLYISINGTSDYVEVSGYFVGDGTGNGQFTYALDQIKFADGTIWNVDKVKTEIIKGTTRDDNLIGYETADTLSGLAGNDQIQGHGGDDILSGGDGNDSLYGQEGNDVLKGDAG